MQQFQLGRLIPSLNPSHHYFPSVSFLYNWCTDVFRSCAHPVLHFWSRFWSLTHIMLQHHSSLQTSHTCTHIWIDSWLRDGKSVSRFVHTDPAHGEVKKALMYVPQICCIHWLRGSDLMVWWRMYTLPWCPIKGCCHAATQSKCNTFFFCVRTETHTSKTKILLVFYFSLFVRNEQLLYILA